MSMTLFGIVIVAGMAQPAPAAPAADPLIGGFVIEFLAIPDNPDRNYHMQMSVVVEGHDKKYTTGIGIGVADGSGMAAEKLAEFMAFSIDNDDKNWAVERDGPRLLVKSWTDPATGKVHPVKEVKFYTLPLPDAMPKELLPKVKDRRQRA